MDDFFKQFRNNLENRPEPVPEERDWQDLQKRLEQHGKKRAVGFAWWWWWLALPLLLLLLGLNSLSFWELRKANQKIASLEMHRDTIYKTQVIYQTDTIYKTRIIRETVVEYRTVDLAGATAYFANKNGELKIADKGNDNAAMQNMITENNGLKPLPVPNSALQQPDSSNYKGIPENQIFLTDFEKIKNLDFSLLAIPKPAMPKQLEESIVKKQKKTLSQRLYAMRPQGFQLGINGGGAFPFSEEVTPIAGFSMGVQAIVEFSPSLQLWADVTFLNTGFEADRMDASIGVPTVEPPSDDFTFLLAEVPQPSLQFGVGMQYFFNTNGNLHPFVGAGIGAVASLPYEVIYEFENQALGIEWSLDKVVSDSDILTNFWFARAGLAYKISEHLQGQFIGTYRGNWKEKNLQFPQLLGIQVGVNYRFK